MKTFILAATAIVLMSGTAFAASYGSHKHGTVSSYERAAIARSAANLASIKRRAWSDGRLSFFERLQIRIAESRYKALVSKARRS